MIRSWVKSKTVQYLHFGVPCGTSSRAREIPISGSAPGRGAPRAAMAHAKNGSVSTLPIRSTHSLILLCEPLSKAWTLEQPHRSLFWYHLLEHSRTARNPFTLSSTIACSAHSAPSTLPPTWQNSKTCDGQHLPADTFGLQPLQRSRIQNVPRIGQCVLQPGRQLPDKPPGPAQGRQTYGHLLLCLITMVKTL